MPGSGYLRPTRGIPLEGGTLQIIAPTIQQCAAGPATPRRDRLCSVRVFARRAALLIGAMLVLVLSAHPAHAHAFLVRSDPASGVTLAQSPTHIRLWFSEEISPGVSSARLVDGDGAVVGGTKIASRGDDPRLLELTAPRLGSGTYGVLWQVLTEDDGHTTTGTVVFGVGVPGLAPVPAGAAPGLAAPGSAGAAAAPSAVDVALRWARLCALAGL